MVTSPIEHFNEALLSQVPADQVAPEDYSPFPPPLGAWMAKGKPLYFRNQLRASKVTPAGLLHHWTVEHPYHIDVTVLERPAIEELYSYWLEPIQANYNWARSGFADLITVSGKLSDRSRLVCARYGAWRAMKALEVGTMPMSEFSWSGLAVTVAGGVLDVEGNGYTLVSDNYQYKGSFKGAVYTVSELMSLLDADSDSLATVAGVKAVFDRSRVVRAESQLKIEPERERMPGCTHTWPERYLRTG